MAVTRSDYSLSQLEVLEAESIHIMREVAAEFERPVLLFSGGKDSIVMLAPGRAGVLAGEGPVPGDAHGHRAQLPRGARLPGPPGGRGGREAGRRLGAGVHRPGPGGRGDRPLGQPEPAADRRRCWTPSRSTGSTRCSAGRAGTRRRPGPRSGCSRSATSSASGTRRPSGPSCGTSTTPGSGRVSTSGCSRCPTGPSWTSGSTSRREKLEIPSHLLRPPAQGVRAGRHPAGRQRVHHPATSPSRSSTTTVRYRTVGDMTCTGAVESDRDHGGRRHRRDRGHPDHRARPDPGR